MFIQLSLLLFKVALESYVVGLTSFFSRYLAPTVVISICVALLVERLLTIGRHKCSLLSGKKYLSAIVIGTSDKAIKALQVLKSAGHRGLRVVGFVDDNGYAKGMKFYGSTILGKTDELPAILHENYIDEVIFAVFPSQLEDANRLLELCELEGVQTRIISDFFNGTISKPTAEVVHGIPVITYKPAPRAAWQLALKRVMDILVSLLLLIFLSPVFLVIAAAIRLTSKGPIFYKWRVLGKNKKPIISYKFRTMVQDADRLKGQLMAYNEMQGAVFKMKNDPRITKVGRFLRKYSLDELPQLWSVLKGDLSLVGPRPPLQTEIHHFKNWQRRKLSVKPGLTCLWQVNGRNEINDFDHWVKLDLEYIDNWSLWLDFKILFKTIPAVLRGSGM